MRRRTLPWLGTTALGIGAGVFAYYASLPKPTTLERAGVHAQAPTMEPREARSDEELARMRRELAAVKGQLVALGERMQEAPVPARAEEVPADPEQLALDEAQRRAESDRQVGRQERVDSGAPHLIKRTEVIPS